MGFGRVFWCDGGLYGANAWSIIGTRWECLFNLSGILSKKHYISQYNCDKIGAKFNLPFWERID